MADRCTGHCCEDFILPYSPEELHTKMRGHKDDPLIQRMVLYLGKYRAANQDFPGGAEGHHYTCRYFDKKSRDCTIYEQRPDMCRDHPYEKPCTFKGCELTPELKPDVLLTRVKWSGKRSESLCAEPRTIVKGKEEHAVSGRTTYASRRQEVVDDHELEAGDGRE